MQVNPNPASEYIEITIEGETDNSSLILFNNNGKQIAVLTSELLDLNGNLIASRNSGSSKEIILPTINMAKGVYFIELSGTTTHLSKKIIID